jgi:hypothetical protein
MKAPSTFLFLGASIALCLAVTASVPWAIQAPGKLAPLKEWTLVRDADGQLVSTLRNNLTGQLEYFEVFGFERGDHFALDRGNTRPQEAVVSVGDTLGTVRSAALERQRVQLEGELANALAELEVYASGGKEPEVQAAQLEVARRRAQQAGRQQELVRLEGLWHRQLAADAEVTRARTALEVDQLQLQEAVARLEVVSTGAKGQELAWRSVRVQALRGQTQALQERLAGNVIRAPLGGRLVELASADTLMAIHDTTAYLATLPIPWDERANLDPQGLIEIKAEGIEGVLVGKVVQVEPLVHTAGGRPFVAAKALVERGVSQLGPGLVVHCAAATRPVGPWEYLRRVF